MKKILLSLITIALLSSCSNNDDDAIIPVTISATKDATIVKMYREVKTFDLKSTRGNTFEDRISLSDINLTNTDSNPIVKIQIQIFTDYFVKTIADPTQSIFSKEFNFTEKSYPFATSYTDTNGKLVKDVKVDINSLLKKDINLVEFLCTPYSIFKSTSDYSNFVTIVTTYTDGTVINSGNIYFPVLKN